MAVAPAPAPAADRTEMYLTLQVSFGGDQAPSLDHVSFGLTGNAPPEGTQAGSEALRAALVSILGAATEQQQEQLKRAALAHLKQALP